MPLITMGGTVDSAFLAALASAFDPFGNLDKNQDVIGVGHSVKDPNYPYYPVLRWQTDGRQSNCEYRRPWAWPDKSPVQQASGPDTLRTTPTETYNPFRSFGEGPDTAFKPLSGSPYPVGDPAGRVLPAGRRRSIRRSAAPTNWPRRPGTPTCSTSSTWRGADLGFSPLGDPVPFSAHLIAQLANDTGYSTQFNLDSDRAFAYLTWDWIRQDPKTPGSTATGILNLTYQKPVEQPEGDEDPGADPLNPLASANWGQGKPNRPLLLKYKDPPNPPIIIL